MMKRIVLYIFAIVAVMAIPSCNYLEMPVVSTAVNIDTIFSKRIGAERYLTEVYYTIMPFGLPKYTSVYNVSGKGVYDLDHIERGIRAALTDECNQSQGYAPCTEMNMVGYENGDNQVSVRHIETKFNCCYIGIREAFIFIENIDKATDIPQEEKEQMKSECKTLIALRYFTLIRTFGGVPLVKHTLDPNDDMNIERSSIEDCVNYIVQLCDESMNLPDQYESSKRGRVTKGVALAVKARTLLFAASPLWNAATPIIGYENTTKDKLLCYGNYDMSRWEKAIEANKAVIDWAENAGGVRLINTGSPFDDYGTATSIRDNDEVILANRCVVGQTGFTTHYLPTLGAFNKGNSVLVNALPKFVKADGTEQTWPVVGESRPFTDYTERMDQMEPRFYAIGWVYGQKPRTCPTRYDWNYTINGNSSIDVAGCAVMMKFTYNYQGQSDVDFPIFRLAEFYLNYAEALNEYTANDPKAYEALNVIRRRAGLPEIQSSDPRYNTQETLRQAIRRERFVELFAEDHRIYDVRRWRIAHEPGIIGGDMISFSLTANEDKTDYISYKPIVFETRYWANKMYYHPFPIVEVRKGYLLQNPGY